MTGRDLGSRLACRRLVNVEIVKGEWSQFLGSVREGGGRCRAGGKGETFFEGDNSKTTRIFDLLAGDKKADRRGVGKEFGSKTEQTGRGETQMQLAGQHQIRKKKGDYPKKREGSTKKKIKDKMSGEGSSSQKMTKGFQAE